MYKVNVEQNCVTMFTSLSLSVLRSSFDQRLSLGKTGIGLLTNRVLNIVSAEVSH